MNTEQHESIAHHIEKLDTVLTFLSDHEKVGAPDGEHVAAILAESALLSLHQLQDTLTEQNDKT
jgi:hypothetical protein